MAMFDIGTPPENRQETARTMTPKTCRLGPMMSHGNEGCSSTNHDIRRPQPAAEGAPQRHYKQQVWTNTLLLKSCPVNPLVALCFGVGLEA